MNSTTLSSDDPLQCGRTHHKANISEKIKTINNKIEQNKAEYNSNRQTGKISALSSGNISKYEFLTDKELLPEKDLLETAAAMKRFKYSQLGKELKAQTNAAESFAISFLSLMEKKNQ